MNRAKLERMKARLREVVEERRRKEALNTPCHECGHVLGADAGTVIFDTLSNFRPYCKSCVERAEDAGMKVVAFPMPLTDDFRSKLGD